MEYVTETQMYAIWDDLNLDQVQAGYKWTRIRQYLEAPQSSAAPMSDYLQSQLIKITRYHENRSTPFPQTYEALTAFYNEEIPNW